MEKKSLSISAEMARARAEIVFVAYGQLLRNNILFKYLGRLLPATYND